MNFAELFPDFGVLWQYLPAIRSTDTDHNIEAQPWSDFLLSTQAPAPLVKEDIQFLEYDRATHVGMKSHTLPTPSSQVGPSYPYLSASSSPSRNSSPSRTSSEQARFEAARSLLTRTFARERETGITNWPTADEFEAQRLLEEEEHDEMAFEDVLSYVTNTGWERQPQWVRFARLWEWECEILRHSGRWLGNQARKGGRCLFGTGVALVRRMVDFDFDDNVECVLRFCIGGLVALALGFVGVLMWTMIAT